MQIIPFLANIGKNRYFMLRTPDSFGQRERFSTVVRQYHQLDARIIQRLNNCVGHIIWLSA